MVEIHATNYASFAYTVNAEDTTAIDVQFVTSSGTIINTNELAIFVSGGTFAIDSDTQVVTVTPASAGKVSVFAVKTFPVAE